jgi:hypothetical protein
MRIQIPLLANQPLRQFFNARCVVVMSTGAAADVNLTLFGSSQQDAEDFGSCSKNFAVFSPERAYTGVELTATVNCTVELIVSNARVEALDGATVTATLDAAQLPLPVHTVGVPLTDRSGTIAAGGTSQQLMAANAARRGLFVQNHSATDSLWIDETGSAEQGQPSIRIPPGAMYETPAGGCPLSAVAIVGPTLGQAFTAREW